ncbi:response regulator [Thalassomonas haliotis]|nr:response regulator [Thalassomonas haliotis]
MKEDERFIKEKQAEQAVVNILSVDDNPRNLLVIEDILGELQQNIVSKSSGEEALKYLLDHEVAVILLDVRMPGIDGLETAALIRQRKLSEYTPIIFITATSPVQEEVTRAYLLGAVDYIFKPIVSEVLKSKVKVFIDLHRKTLALRQQSERNAELYRKTLALRQQSERKEAEARELRSALSSMQMLTGWQQGSVTASLAGVGPLRERSGQEFTEIQASYEAMLDGYLEAIGFGRMPQREQINKLAERIGFLGGGPRDVIDVHLRAVVEKCRDVHPAREQAYAVEGRLLALELMGFLVDYYRRLRIPSASGSKTLPKRNKQ